MIGAPAVALAGDWIADVKTGCKIWNPAPAPGETVNWAGPCNAGFAEESILTVSICSPGPTLKYERIVSASTRRLPSTTIDAVLALVSAGWAIADPDLTPHNATPRSMPATTSPRLTPTHISMRYAPLSPRGRPQWRVSRRLPRLPPQFRDKFPPFGIGARFPPWFQYPDRSPPSGPPSRTSSDGRCH